MTFRRSLRFYRNLIAALALCAAFAASANVQAATKEDLDDPDYVKRYYQTKSTAAAGNAGTTGSVSSDGYFTDKNADKYTGIKYTHSDRFKDCDILHGIDISRHNKIVNWEKVKADGIDFTILRIGYSRLNTDTVKATSKPGSLNLTKDENYETNLKGVKKAGLPMGVYYFSQAITVKEAETEADYVLELLGGRKLDLPVVFDSEMTPGGRLALVNPDKASYNKIAKAFCEKIKAAGYTPMVYSSYNGMKRKYNAAELESLYEIWLARYNNNTYYDGKYTIWQYASGGKVDGCSTTVDMNFYYRPKSAKSLYEPVDESKRVSGLSVKQASSSSLSISFTALSSVTGYNIQRSESYDGPFANIAKVTGTSYTDTGLEAGREYYYRITANYTADGKTKTGPASAVAYASTAGTGTRTAKVNQLSHIRALAGTDYDSVGYVQAGTKLTVLASTKNIDGVTWYKVKTTINGKQVTGYISGRCADAVLGRVANVKLKKNTAKTLTIGWSAVGGADGYEIFCASAPNGTYKKVGEVTGKTYFKHTKLKKYTEYYYKVRAVCHVDTNNNSYGKYSKIGTFATKKTKAKYRSTGVVTLRKYAGTKYKKLCMIPSKTKMTVYYRTKDNAGTTWYHVKVKVKGKSYKGYVSSKYVKKK